MSDAERILAVNRECWNRVAAQFVGSTALPHYGPLAPTEDTLRLLPDPLPIRVLELGCGSGHSPRFLAGRGAEELWGLDFSPVQIGLATETLRECSPRVTLLGSPMDGTLIEAPGQADMDGGPDPARFTAPGQDDVDDVHPQSAATLTRLLTWVARVALREARRGQASHDSLDFRFAGRRRSLDPVLLVL